MSTETILFLKYNNASGNQLSMSALHAGVRLWKYRSKEKEVYFCFHRIWVLAFNSVTNILNTIIYRIEEFLNGF